MTPGPPGTWANPTGAINPKEIGKRDVSRTRPDGSKLYVVMESPTLLNKAGSKTVLAGVFLSPNGSISGPYNQIATVDGAGETAARR